MLFPFLPLTISLATGIFLSDCIPLSPAGWTTLATLFLVCAWLFFSLLRKSRACVVLILMTAMFMGASLYSVRRSSYEKNPLKKIKSASYLDFCGRLYKSVSRGTESDYLFLRVDKVVMHRKEKAIEGNLRITVPRSRESPSPLRLHNRDEIKVSAKLSSSRGFRNFHPEVLDRYLENQNLHRRAHTKTSLLIEKRESGGKISVLHAISVIRGQLQRCIEKGFPGAEGQPLSSTGAVVEALLLGERERMDPEILRSLQRAGIFHLFALSGAHIAILSFLLFSVFGLFKIPERSSCVLLILFLLFYALLISWAGSSGETSTS
jgi:competence protein ComEC